MADDPQTKFAHPIEAITADDMSPKKKKKKKHPLKSEASVYSKNNSKTHFKPCMETSLVVQWIRIHFPVQGTWVRSLGQEDSAC